MLKIFIAVILLLQFNLEWYWWVVLTVISFIHLYVKLDDAKTIENNFQEGYNVASGGIQNILDTLYKYKENELSKIDTILDRLEKIEKNYHK
jgi:hypothetical protein